LVCKKIEKTVKTSQDDQSDFFCLWFQSRQQIAILSDGLLQSTNRVFQLHENLLQCHEDLRQTREDLLRGKDNFRVIIVTALGVHVYDVKQKKESSGGEVDGGGGGGVSAGGGGAGGVSADGLYGTVDTNLRGWSGGTISENVWHHSIPVGTNVGDDIQKRASEYIFSFFLYAKI
jgi:hypothetical protein